jgi:uncharacterized membrane protein YjjB (DUF3815 family)
MIFMDILTDALFGAMAGIGFGAISNPPVKAFKGIALLAAMGHATRTCLMQGCNMNIASASLVAALLIGWGALLVGKLMRTPMTVLYIPALLPMVPGIYAYKVVLSLLLFFHHINDASASQYMENTIANSLVTFTTIFNLAVGATLPVLINKKTAYSLTRGRKLEETKK